MLGSDLLRFLRSTGAGSEGCTPSHTPLNQLGGLFGVTVPDKCKLTICGGSHEMALKLHTDGTCSSGHPNLASVGGFPLRSSTNPTRSRAGSPSGPARQPAKGNAHRCPIDQSAGKMGRPVGELAACCTPAGTELQLPGPSPGSPSRVLQPPRLRTRQRRSVLRPFPGHKSSAMPGQKMRGHTANQCKGEGGG